MPRVNPVVARTARRALVLSTGPFDSHSRMRANYNTILSTCPYCALVLKSALGCTRHITMKPACRAKHQLAVREEGRKALERSYKIAGPSSQPAMGAPPTAGTGDQRHGQGRPRWDDDGRTCEEPFVEEFPINTAGQPISNRRTSCRDLGSYLASCGKMANCECFEAAELLMTTGLSAKSRTRHLQSSFVSCYRKYNCTLNLPGI